MKTKSYISHQILLFIVVLALTIGCSPSKKLSSTDSSSLKQDDDLALRENRQAAALFSDGLGERLAGNYEKARSLFQQAIELNPSDHASMYELSELYARNGRIDESLEHMEKAVKLSPDNEWYLIRLAQIYRYKGENQAYADTYKKLLEMYPEKLEYYSELSMALLLIGKYDEALAIFNKIEKQIGVNESLSMQKHNIQLSRKDFQGAIDEIVRLSDAFPFEVKYHAMLAELYMKYGPKEKALEQYKKVVELNPKDPYVNISLAEYYRDAGEDETAFQYLLKAFENPVLEIETKVQVMVLWFTDQTFSDELNLRAEKIGTIFIEVHPDSPRGYQLLADVMMRRENYEGARNYFLKALEKDKNNYLVWESLLFVDGQLNDFESLENDARETILLFPEQPLPYYFHGLVLSRNKQWTEALKVLETGRKLVIGNDRLLGEFFSNIGDVQYQLGNHNASFEAYEKALAINPVNNVVLNNYAYYLSLRVENLEKAHEMSRKAIEIDPKNSSYLDTYAWVLYKMNDFENARIWIEKAVENSETISGTLLEHFGDILFQLGEKKQAVEKWKQALKAGDVSEFIELKIKDEKLYE